METIMKVQQEHSFETEIYRHLAVTGQIYVRAVKTLD